MTACGYCCIHHNCNCIIILLYTFRGAFLERAPVSMSATMQLVLLLVHFAYRLLHTASNKPSTKACTTPTSYNTHTTPTFFQIGYKPPKQSRPKQRKKKHARTTHSDQSASLPPKKRPRNSQTEPTTQKHTTNAHQPKRQRTKPESTDAPT